MPTHEWDNKLLSLDLLPYLGNLLENRYSLCYYNKIYGFNLIKLPWTGVALAFFTSLGALKKK